jgi:hypothetical protein
MVEIRADDHLDHFLEDDTILHSWEALSQLMQHPECQDILIDVGMPVKHKVSAPFRTPHDYDLSDPRTHLVCKIQL